MFSRLGETTSIEERNSGMKEGKDALWWKVCVCLCNRMESCNKKCLFATERNTRKTVCVWVKGKSVESACVHVRGEKASEKKKSVKGSEKC